MIAAERVAVTAGGATIVDGVDLAVAPGELLALVGPNGAGKSTLLGALAGDRRLARGTVRLAGRDVRARSAAELARVRAVLPQRASLAVAYTALEVVALARGDLAPAVARRYLDEVQLGSLAARNYLTLSGGEQQRVQLARVLAQLDGVRAAALFLDEPTAALDPRHQTVVLGLARRAAAAGHAVVVVLHDLTLAARWADRVAVMAAGRIAAAGRPGDVLVPDVLAAAYETGFEVLRGGGGLVVVPAAAAAAAP